MSKYYYRFPAESSEGKLLRSFHRAAQKAEREAQQYAKKVGAATYYEDPNCFTGGVVAVTFKNPKEVNPNIWRLVGKQEESNELLYLPNTVIKVGNKMIGIDEKLPRDSAHRIWREAHRGDSETERKVTYIDIFPVVTDAPKADRKRAVQAEFWRLKLPVVRLSSFYQIVHADLSDICENDTPKKVQESSPVFYRYHNHYYIGLDHPIHHDGFEEINQYIFNTTKRELLFEEKIKNEKDDLDD
jgi:hypothetical protein